MPSAREILYIFFKKADLFQNNQLLRYNGNSEYTTVTGGIISTVLIIIYVVLFSSMGLKTLKREIITSYVYTENQAEPSQLTINASPEGGFMFSLFIYGIDLTQTTHRLFNISLYQQFYSTGHVLINSTSIPLQPCTREHFDFNQGIGTMYSKLGLGRGLCAPLSQRFKLEGKVSSDFLANFRFSINRCNSTLDNTCASDLQFAAAQNALGKFSLIVPIVNGNINANSQDYKSFSLDDTNYFPFTSKLGISALGFVEEDLIRTDQSIFPGNDYVQETVINVPKAFLTSYYLTSAGEQLAEIIFQKSQTKSTYFRSFNKIDTFLSYVGGIIGITMPCVSFSGTITKLLSRSAWPKRYLLTMSIKRQTPARSILATILR